MNIIIDISADPVLGLKRKLTVDEFRWHLGLKTLKLNCTVKFYGQDNETEISTERIKPYGVCLTGDDTISEEFPEGEYAYFISAYFSNPVILKDVFTGIIQSRDLQGRFDI